MAFLCSSNSRANWWLSLDKVLNQQQTYFSLSFPFLLFPSSSKFKVASQIPFLSFPRFPSTCISLFFLSSLPSIALQE